MIDFIFVVLVDYYCNSFFKEVNEFIAIPIHCKKFNIDFQVAQKVVIILLWQRIGSVQCNGVKRILILLLSLALFWQGN